MATSLRLTRSPARQRLALQTFEELNDMAHPTLSGLARGLVLASTFVLSAGASGQVGPNADAAASAPSAAAPAPLASDTPARTTRGDTFVAPAAWTLRRQGDAVILEAPEAGSWLAFVDLDAPDADAAVAQAWHLLAPDFARTLRVVTGVADRDGWTGRRNYDYKTSPNEHRTVSADARRASGRWTVLLEDFAQDVEEKRESQVGLVYGKWLPAGYSREDFAGRKAHALDAGRVAQLRQFVAQAMQETGVPGVSFGVVQDGKVVWSGGLGVRQLGRSPVVDGDTRFMIASNTKALVTLMLARLVDQGRLSWDEPVVALWPDFRLGSDAMARQVLVRHLICACTGMPRQDMEWIFQYDPLTPQGLMSLLGTMQPTSDFGQLFQYSNPLAAGAGYLGGHVAHPKMELGAAYDRAMQELVFDPLGMRDTTQDFAVAQRGNAAVPHAPDIDGRPALALGQANLSIVPLRPAGAVWSSTNDMLKYVAMELANGALPDGSRLLSPQALLARRAPQVVVGTDVTYGMGLMVDKVYGATVVHHGGDMIGFHSDMIWLPEQNVGAVILTNGDPGWLIRSVFRRKLLEVLFDGRPEADAAMAAQAKAFFDDLAADRRLLVVPPDQKAASGLARHYSNAAIGDVTVTSDATSTTFDFGEWASAVGSKANPDGTISMITTAPGMNGFEFAVGRTGDKRTLTLRDGQHAYVMVER
jgi:CubicO group peptidase (beta-lactamase class C family)